MINEYKIASNEIARILMDTLAKDGNNNTSMAQVILENAAKSIDNSLLVVITEGRKNIEDVVISDYPDVEKSSKDMNTDSLGREWDKPLNSKGVNIEGLARQRDVNKLEKQIEGMKTQLAQNAKIRETLTGILMSNGMSLTDLQEAFTKAVKG